MTDGEYRRGWYHSDFLANLKGVAFSTYKMNLFGEETTVGSTKLVERIRWNEDHPFIEHFRYLKALADQYQVIAKLDIPGPNMVLLDTITTSQDNVYGKDIQLLAKDFIEVYKQAIQSFYQAGCRYLQIDDPVWVSLCEPSFQKKIQDAGFELETVKQIFFEISQEILNSKPSDLSMTLHLCQGNLRSKKFYNTGYDDIVDTIFSLPYDGFFMEFDEEAYCHFELLQKLQGQKIVLGLVSTQIDQIEDKEILIKRVERAKQFVDPKQICISTQCGFASTAEGNLISERIQWEKVDLVKEIAELTL